MRCCQTHTSPTTRAGLQARRRSPRRRPRRRRCGSQPRAARLRSPAAPGGAPARRHVSAVNCARNASARAWRPDSVPPLRCAADARGSRDDAHARHPTWLSSGRSAHSGRPASNSACSGSAAAASASTARPGQAGGSSSFAPCASPASAQHAYWKTWLPHRPSRPRHAAAMQRSSGDSAGAAVVMRQRSTVQQRNAYRRSGHWSRATSRFVLVLRRTGVAYRYDKNDVRRTNDVCTKLLSPAAVSASTRTATC